MNPSSRRRRAPRRSSRLIAATDPCARSPFALTARRRPAAAASNAAGIGATLELSSEGRVFGNDFLIRLGFDRAAGGSRGGACFGVLQISIDRPPYDARFNGYEIDAHQRDAHPRVDDDPLIENPI